MEYAGDAPCGAMELGWPIDGGAAGDNAPELGGPIDGGAAGDSAMELGGPIGGGAAGDSAPELGGPIGNAPDIEGWPALGDSAPEGGWRRKAPMIERATSAGLPLIGMGGVVHLPDGTIIGSASTGTRRIGFARTAAELIGLFHWEAVSRMMQA